MSLELCAFQVRSYRSLRAIAYPVSGLEVFVGANGVGKTHLYRALEQVQAAAANRLSPSLVAEGGLPRVLWAGERRKTEPARLILSVDLRDPAQRSEGCYRYRVEVGFPPLKSAAFQSEPHIKAERLERVGRARTLRLMDREGLSVMARDETGRPVALDMDLLESETVLGRLEDPSRHPELDLVRRTLLQWRFHHALRTDPDSPLRRPCPAAAATALASDGSNLAAVFATLAHIRQDRAALDHAVAQAFPGAELVLPPPDDFARFGLRFAETPKRVFEARELSDGALRFLALAGALLAYRPAPFMALNEPETSLHPDLLPPLADLIADAARRGQVWLTTHAQSLADAVAAAAPAQLRQVRKQAGETVIEGLRPWGGFDSAED